MSAFAVTTRSKIPKANQAIFDSLQKRIGFVPDLYAYYRKNKSALGNYLEFENSKNTLKAP